MGLGCGVSAILPRLTFGLYKSRELGRVALNVDGELIRYKGMIRDNITCHDAEEAIAETSYDYLVRLTRDVETHLGRRVDETAVYMDGQRVINKLTNRPDFKFDAGLIRVLFGQRCTENGMRMVWLDVGESEIQMYLRRDRGNDLNIFVSNDSDVIPIMYAHEPIVAPGHESEARKQEVIPRRESSRIKDNNRTYSEGKNVRDSCLWIKCGSNGVEAYGMDNARELLKFEPRAFRVLTAACGTDFTCSPFTDTMAQLVILAFGSPEGKENADLLNAQTDVLRIMAGLIYLAVTFGCTLKRETGKRIVDTPELRETFRHAENMISVYLHYTETGEMMGDILQPDPTYLLRLCLFAMIGDDASVVSLTKKELGAWGRRVPLKTALANFDANRASEATHQRVLATYKVAAKRKQAAAEQASKRYKVSMMDLMPDIHLNVGVTGDGSNVVVSTLERARNGTAEASPSSSSSSAPSSQPQLLMPPPPPPSTPSSAANTAQL